MLLYRLIYSSESAGPAKTSLLTIAQILGSSERNNRRDRITGSIMFYEGGYLQVLEGARVDIDRLMGRLRQDARHTRIRVLSDSPVAKRLYDAPMAVCDNPTRAMEVIGAPDLASVTAYDAERLMTLQLAA
ncbi:hypothetical protein BZG35_00085 [Brevundimonas sp. LM2]|nr:hypothetical protein BZG35_00085 [Brevundimonas sp. LM2]